MLCSAGLRRFGFVKNMAALFVKESFMTNPFFPEQDIGGSRKAAFSPLDLSILKRENRPVYLFGCGDIGEKAASSLGGFSLRGYLDNKSEVQGKTVNGLRVFPPLEVAERIKSENALVLISIFNETFSREIEVQCAEMGVEYVHWYDTMPEPGYRIFGAEHAEDPDVIAGLGIWDEELSKEVYRDIIRFRISLNPADRPDVILPQYFIDEVPPPFLKNIVDVGAFDGDTLRVFLSIVGNGYESYHAFEPLAEYRPQLGQTASCDPRIKIYPCALSDHSYTTMMLDKASGSRLEAKGGTREVAVKRLDDVLSGNPVSFIKMDVEGVESEVLRGAESTIRRNRPVLAISVYHKPDHLYTIPQWIRQLDLGYRLLLRHHSRRLDETVCYAIPS